MVIADLFVIHNMSIISVLVILSSLRFGECKHGEMKANILNGLPGRIEDFPHATYVLFSSSSGDASCGGSIVNQRIVVTAAHCMADCKQCPAMAVVGHKDFNKGVKIRIIDQYVHEGWDIEKFTNDISLMFLEHELKFNAIIKRVAIMKSPPQNKNAQVAGWGLVQGPGVETIETDFMQFTEIKVVSDQVCEDFLQTRIPNTFCGDGVRISTVTCGDSGSGLIVDKYIQIGLVSCGLPDRSKTMAVFTNVSAFYDWIQTYSKFLYCSNIKDAKA